MDTPNPKTTESVSSGKVASNSEPLVSVLIPCYNAEQYIGETLDSVIAQTYPHWECIVVDDHSTDNSAEIVQSYCRKYPDKIFLYTNPRKGACAARNVAFEKSKGEFIQYLDADDLISENKFEEQIKTLKDKKSHLAICNTFHFYTNIKDSICTDKEYVYTSYSPPDFLINLWGGSNLPPHYIAVHSWLTPRKLINDVGQWNESLYKDQDGEFFARVVLKSKGIVFANQAKSYYRKQSSGNNIASQKKRKHMESNLLSAKLKEKYLFEKKLSLEAKKALSVQYKVIAISAWPNYKDISEEAINRCNQLGGTDFLPQIGGSIVEFIKNSFGWKAAKLTSIYGRPIKNILLKLKHLVLSY